MPETTSAERAALVLAAQREKWADRQPVNMLTRQQLRRLVRVQKKQALSQVAREARLARRYGGRETGPITRALIEKLAHRKARLETTKDLRAGRQLRRATRRALASGKAA